MANSITQTITESITLEGNAISNSLTNTVSNLVYKESKIINLSTSFQTIVTADATASAFPKYDWDKVNYLSITNLDDTNLVYIELELSTGTDFAYLTIGPGMWWSINSLQNYIDDDSGLDADIEAIQGKFRSSEGNIELLIGSIA